MTRDPHHADHFPDYSDHEHRIRRVEQMTDNIRNRGEELARWQGGVDAALRSHEERLNATSADIRSIKDTAATLRDDMRELKGAVGRMERQDRLEKDEGKFRWTKMSVLVAAVSVVVIIAFNFYFAAHH